ncbi:Predicted amidohydrolase [Salinihabitans flavidus]|uniref:Predicted amidohydrolase n=1 Tax=Salinihabitans flavidus TaxID=569882 RepID=A0A1H8P639_9RHOB|nr:carbon-nitrogen hydrolase family protein [Salinihabitans flavidus]SEO37277.1 Predicted amidohydrolase [Salinihabitans flavidus]
MMLRLAMWQGEGVPDDRAATLQEVERVLADAVEAGADLVVFPEGYLTGYHIPELKADDLADVEEALNAVGRIAAEKAVPVVMGTHVVSAEGVRNAAVVFSSSGEELGRYYKRLLFGAWEKQTFVPGSHPTLFEISGLRVGVLICYDVEFPELVREQAQAGADLVVVPTALMSPHERVARQLVPVRSMENQIFLGYANRTGSEFGLDFVGLSSINGPNGETLASAGTVPKLLLADLDPGLLQRERAENSYLKDLERFRNG